jgi:ABC-type phosphate transport system substrate-binding protein
MARLVFGGTGSGEGILHFCKREIDIGNEFMGAH